MLGNILLEVCAILAEGAVGRLGSLLSLQCKIPLLSSTKLFQHAVILEIISTIYDNILFLLFNYLTII